jgi:hypothetical protein
MSLEQAKSSARKWLIRLTAGGTVLAIAGTILYTYSALHFAFSKGERVGFVQKISERGWLCKTNEGDLAMTTVVGQPSQAFAFTVKDSKVVADINALAGRKVALIYEEHKGLPSRCFGDTDYFVVGVRKAE